MKILKFKYLAYKLAKNYLKYYKNFSYNFEKNGEGFLLKRLLNDKIHTVFDVGANTGHWTDCALSVNAIPQFHLFEISSETFSTLERKFKDSEKVILNNFALSDEVGLVKYNDFGKGSGLNTLVTNSDIHKMKFASKEIKSTTGDLYCAENNLKEIDFLKIDVEGAENRVLNGFKEMFSKNAVKVVQFEYGFANGDAKFLLKDFYDFFREFDFALGPLKRKGVIFMDFNYGLNHFDSGPNFVAVSKQNPEIIEKIRGPSIPGYP